MRLNQLLPKVNSNIKITGIAYRHTSVKPGYMFVTWCGRSVNGHPYIHEALKRGASFVICEKTLSPNIPHLKVHDARRMLAEVSRRFYGYPDRKLNIVGITGTNGKTTTVLLLHHILKKYLRTHSYCIVYMGWNFVLLVSHIWDEITSISTQRSKIICVQKLVCL
ncbi:hypothetical protein CGW93_02740 [candidate division bacterium WOR-3 4484_18]|uniref:Mur ligase N-terminal catalytic domain-containing protein n=1 Tax=candidate division WOR-3 bacterium 4484_18 TaxID=2020626 RepID=A0A257LTN7_UNCW3|nr:MAG: hypothetical protein CGW93_02740 [candidate division bacterium WOR-3 4484_18]